MSRHTPGPWVRGQGRNAPQIIEGDGRVAPKIIAEIYYYRMTNTERDANARLVAAAPDLLAACEAVLADNTDANLWGDHGLAYAVIEQVEKAIKKAKGDPNSD